MEITNVKVTLGIETSCDETALAILATKSDGEYCVYSSLVHSQAELHSAYGGVYPTLAKREHGKNIVALFHNAIIQSEEFLSWRDVDQAHYRKTIESFRAEIAPQNPELFETFVHADFLKRVPNIDEIAVTDGPGLEPALWVGINFGRMLSALWQIPLVPINHMEGHIVGSILQSDALNGAWHKLHAPPFPALAFLLSGGHTLLVSAENFNKYKIIGETVDDAVGECYDKCARLLGLSYPGGPHLARLAKTAREQSKQDGSLQNRQPEKFGIRLPRPMMTTKDLNFSFSGLKTAVLYATRTAPRDTAGNITHDWKLELAREFEDAITETLCAKLRKAIEETGAQSIIIGGGVIANEHLRNNFKKLAGEYSLPLYLPDNHLSGDNALMIALAAAMRHMNGSPDHAAKTPGVIRALGTKRLS